MRLQEELDRLADEARAFTDVERVLRLAQRRRVTRAVLAPAAVVVVVVLVVAVVPRWWAHGNQVADGSPRTRLTLTVPDGTAVAPGQLNRDMPVLHDRAAAAGVRAAVQVTGDRTMWMDFAGHPDQARLRRLVAPGVFTMRLVVDATQDRPGAPEPVTDGAARPSLEDVTRKLGAAYTFAQTLGGPTWVDDNDLQRLAPFRDLTPAEVAVLPAAMQFNVPTVSCRQLDARPYLPATGRLTACGSDFSGATKYLLDAPAVTRADVDRATVRNVPLEGGWQVLLEFTAAGQARWTGLTRVAYDNGAEHQIAILFDHTVVSAPAIKAVITGDGLIGAANRTEAVDAAVVLRTGPLPVPLAVSGVTVTG